MKRREKLIQLRNNIPRPIIAKQLGITPQMLGMIERGERTPSLPLAKKIADFYGVTVEEIFLKLMETYRVNLDQKLIPPAQRSTSEGGEGYMIKCPNCGHPFEICSECNPCTEYLIGKCPHVNKLDKELFEIQGNYISRNKTLFIIATLFAIFCIICIGAVISQFAS